MAERYATQEVGRAAARLRALQRKPREIPKRLLDTTRRIARDGFTSRRRDAATARRIRVRLALDLADLIVGLGPTWDQRDWCRFLRGSVTIASQRYFERWKVDLRLHAPDVLALRVHGGNRTSSCYELDVARALAWSDLVLGLDGEPGEDATPSIFGPGPWGKPCGDMGAERRRQREAEVAAVEASEGNEEAPRTAGRQEAA